MGTLVYGMTENQIFFYGNGLLYKRVKIMENTCFLYFGGSI
jgi:hypothetical protein